MIGDDDFFMQNSDYHYGASDVEKMYGRSYNNDSALEMTPIMESTALSDL